MSGRVEAVRRAGWAGARETARRVVEELVERFSRNDILTRASAISFQLLVAFVPLVLLALTIAGYIGGESFWTGEVEPFIQSQFSATFANAISTVVERVITEHKLTWLLIALVLTIWEWSGSVRASMGALNRIFEVEESRSVWHRFGLSFALAVAAAGGILAALAVVAFGDRLLGSSLPGPLSGIARWVVAVVLLWLALLILLRFAPAQNPPVRWLSLGGAVVIVAWIVATLVFRWYVTHVANFETAFGSVTSFIVLSGYLYTSSIIFLVGAQIDQLLREEADGEAKLLEPLTD